MKNILCKGKL